MKRKYIELHDLEVYKLARIISTYAWNVYESLEWQDKKVMGDQFIQSADSVGANIAEGYKRYHYLDKVKFYYVSRASLSEACDHWLELLFERGKVNAAQSDSIKEIEDKLSRKLCNFISQTIKSKGN